MNNQRMKGITALVIATLFFAIQDAITKHLTHTLPAPQIVFIRFFFFALFSLIYAAKTIGLKKAFVSNHRILQIIRGLLIVTEIIVFSVAIRHLGIAEIHTLLATFPLIVTALSPYVLGETIGWRRWLAVAIGFLGTLIILRPGFSVINPYSLIALVSATMFAVYNLLTRKVSNQDRFETSLLYFGVVGFLGSLLIAPFFWQPVDAGEMGWLFTLSIVTIISHLLLIKALQWVPAVILQPFNYLVLVWAMIIGFFVFGEILDGVTIAGAMIVVCSGIFIARREYRLSLQTG